MTRVNLVRWPDLIQVLSLSLPIGRAWQFGWPPLESSSVVLSILLSGIILIKSSGLTKVLVELEDHVVKRVYDTDHSFGVGYLIARDINPFFVPRPSSSPTIALIGNIDLVFFSRHISCISLYTRYEDDVGSASVSNSLNGCIRIGCPQPVMFQNCQKKCVPFGNSAYLNRNSTYIVGILLGSFMMLKSCYDRVNEFEHRSGTKFGKLRTTLSFDL